MGTHVQTGRPLSVKVSSLGKDDLLLVGFSGHEGVSQLFNFQLDLVAENSKNIAFDQVLGQPVTVSLSLPNGKKRFFNGICNRFGQGERDNTFTQYRMEIVPHFWLLTRKAQCRIFQHMTVPDILKKVLAGLDVDPPQIQGKFAPRDYCVQYRETDFNFASRLMEEQGIFYFFKHSDGGHKMVLANTPQSHVDVPEASKILYEGVTGATRDEGRILEWEKVQELRSGKYTLWDYCFELPYKHLEAEKPIQESVGVGKVTHKLKVGGNDKLEIYDYPGEYAQRFDGVDKGGGDKADNLKNIFDENKRTVEIRMQEEALQSLVIRGSSDCGQLTAGHKFTLDKHFDADGAYVLTSVSHSAHLGADYQSGSGGGSNYHNSFTCIPVGLPFRPPRTTPKPVVSGTQSAVVVTKPGSEIDCDKYGRVKVQFYWDRDGKKNLDSSCWIRVVTPWGGKDTGMFRVPRGGEEVAVAFEEGDPDKPIIVACIFNADTTVPYKLPDRKMELVIKTATTPGGGSHNELSLSDEAEKQEIYLRASKDHKVAIVNDHTEWVGNSRWIEVDANETTTIGANRTEQVTKDEAILIKGKRTEKVEKDENIQIVGKRTENVVKDEDIKIAGKRTETVGGIEIIKIKNDRTLEVKGDETIDIGSIRLEKVKEDEEITVGSNRSVTVGAIELSKIDGDYTIDAAKKIVLQAGGAQIEITPSTITILAGALIKAKASGEIEMKSDGSLTAMAGGIVIVEAGGVNQMKGGNITLTGCLTKIN